MKRYLPFALVTVLFMASASFSFSAEPFVLSGNPNSPPVSWEENNVLKGVAPTLASSILNTLGVKYRFAPSGTWKKAQELTRQGKIDMLVSAYRNDEREKYLIFSEPFLSQPIVVVVKQGYEFKLTHWIDLAGKKGVSNLGESYGEDLDRFINTKLDVTYVPLERAIQELVRGEADYMIIDLYTALVYENFLQGKQAVSVLEPALSVQDFHFAINKDSELASHLQEINGKITELSGTDEITNLLLMQFDKWKQLTAKRSKYLEANKANQAVQQQANLKEQKERARQRLIRTMTERDELPQAAR